MIADLIAGVARRHPHPLAFWWLRKATGTQITASQLNAITREVRSRVTCNFLVFGLGYDSVYWHRLNRDGRTLFLEDNANWIDSIRSRHAELAIERVTYWTRQRDWRTLHETGERLSLDLPDGIRQQRWDVILVDAPPGWHENTPGRAQSIYTAAELCDPGGTVFVHDCERAAEAFWCDLVFGPERLLDQIEGKRKQGWLRQYRAVAPDRILLDTHVSPSNR
jgi:hypothetical protein